VVVLLFFGMVGDQIVYWTLNLGWALTRSAFDTAGDTAANFSVELGDAFTTRLIAAYWFSFFWSASAAVYLILRRAVDKCELDEMDTFESDVELSLPDIPKTPQVPTASQVQTAPQSSPRHESAMENSGTSTGDPSQTAENVSSGILDSDNEKNEKNEKNEDRRG